MRTLYALLVGGVLALSSCSPQLTTFTEDLYESYKWSDEDLKKVQFYLSDDLVIYRDLEKDAGVEIARGEIKVVDGKKVEQIRFKAGTPGVYLFKPKDDNFAISFENGDETHYLVFGPNPKYSGRYMLLASEWDRRRGKVSYAGEKFYTTSAVVPRLLVDLKKTGYRKTESRTVGGRRIE
jgi:hypothetical protein